MYKRQVTSRGLKEADMELVAGYIARIISEGEAAVPEVKEGVLALTKKYPLYE